MKILGVWRRVRFALYGARIMEVTMRLWIPILWIPAAACAALAGADPLTRVDLEGLLDSTVHGWRFKHGEVPGAEAPDFDDSDWELVDVGHQWWPENSTCWYRTRITIPEYISGAPVAGSTVRLRVGMDNEAKAYVNGEFRQQFRWADGDFVLTQNARPGETITVALYGINRPGYGSLYQAHLVLSGSEALPQLLHAFDVAESYIRYASAEDAEHWRALIWKSMVELAPAKRRSAERKPFLDLVAQAEAVLLSDARTLDRDLRRIAKRLAKLKKRIRQGVAIGRQMAYQRVDARVVGSFLYYVQDDILIWT